MTTLKELIKDFSEKDENELGYKNSEKSIQLR